MLKRIKLILLSFSLFLVSSGALADVLECDACSTSEYKSLAIQWGFNNIENFNTGISKNVHVVDIANRNLVSYRVTKSKMRRPGKKQTRYVVSAKIAQTPSDIRQKFNMLKSSIQTLSNSMGSVVIPENVISDAWEFTGCAYCQASIENHLDQTVGGAVLTVITAFSDFFQFVGVINSDLFIRYELQLASGGRVDINLGVIVNPGDMKIEIVKVFDSDGNEVPLSGNELEGLSLKISTPSRAETINQFINRFNLSVPKNTGRVTITDCGDMGCDSI